jgi:PKD domain
MRQGPACATVLLVCAACARHVAPAPGDDRSVASGVPVVYGTDQSLPKGTRIVWDFGDGTPPVEGARVEHAFPRAGSYRVTETVVGSDGQKESASANATVLRRSVPAAVPSDVRAAWIQERPWDRVAVHRATAAKLSLSDAFEETNAELSEALAFDALDPRAASENGFDPDEGLALFTVPQDQEALVAAVGTSDDAKALAAVKRLLSKASEGRFAGGPFQLTDTRTESGVPVLLGAGRGGEQIGVVLRFGYLYLRLPGLTDPMLALRGVIALLPSGGLAGDAAFQKALEHVGEGDVVFFSRPSDKNGQGRFASQLGLAAFSLLDGPDALRMKLFSQPRRLSGDELQRTFMPLKPPPDLAARLPAGPAAYAKISGRPDALWRELLKASQADATRARERIEELTGLDLEKDLLPAFTGNVGIALYLDASALLEAVLGEEVAAFDRSGFLVAAELSEGRARSLAQAIDRKVPPAQRVPIGGTTLWKLGGGAAMGAVKDGFFYFAIGGLPQDEDEPPPTKPAASGRRRRAPAPVRPARLGPIGLALAPEPRARTLSDELKEAGVTGLDSARDQVGWFDVQGVSRSLQAAAEGEGGVVGAGARVVADRMAALRDAVLVARPGADGVDATLSLDFRRRGRGSPGRGAGGR